MKSVYSCDIDGDLDILSIYQNQNKIDCYENGSGMDEMVLKQSIIIPSAEPQYILVQDIDSDGDEDIISASWEKIFWLENEDGAGFYGEAQTITNNLDGITAIYVCDLDSDDDPDILFSSQYDNKVGFCRNLDGLGLFSNQIIIAVRAGASCVYACDIDGDGDQDVFSSSSIGVPLIWHLNTFGHGTFSDPIWITNDQIYIHSIYASDIDGDQDLDILVAGSNTISWFENMDSEGSFSDMKVIVDYAEYIPLLISTDMDNDGDDDAISYWDPFGENKIAVHKNLLINAIPQITKKSISIYPNPSNERLYFSLETKTIQYLRIFDITGKTILEKTNIPTPESIDISTFKSGIYILSIQTDKEMFTSKFVKE